MQDLMAKRSKNKTATSPRLDKIEMPKLFTKQQEEASSEPEPDISMRAKDGGVTWRSILIGTLLIPPNAYWVVQMERVRYSAHPTTISLFFNVIFILTVITALNWLVRQIAPKHALSQGELLVVYAMLAIASTLCAHDAAQVLVPMMSWPFRFASASNNWESLFIGRLPKWLMVSDKDVIRGYYEGSSSVYRWDYLAVWAVPVLSWLAFIMLLLWIMACINAILRKQWTEREKLSYPIIQLPLEITEGADRGVVSRLFRNKLFWIAFGIAGTVDVINGLNLYFPWIPTILTPGFGQSFLDIGQYVANRPWNAIGWTPVSWYPFMIGLGMIMPLDFLFSCWFFYWFWKAQRIITYAFSWDRTPRFPYTNDQAFGAYIAFVIFSIWLGRDYLKQVWRCIIGLPSEVDDSQEPLRYRWAVVGIIVGMGLLVLFCTAAGMSWWVAVAFFAIYFALAIAITRMRAELGTPVHDLHFTGPDWVMTEILGTKTFGAQNLVMFSLFFWFNRAYRYHPMPHQLEGLKLAERTRGNYKKWFWAIVFAGFVGGLAAFWAMLHLMYEYGATARSGTFGPEAYDRLVSWLNNREGPSAPAGIAVLVGLGFAMFLQAMRVRFPWWPFHPLGYAVTESWEMNLVWMPLFIAWVLKLVILRYSGLQGFRRSLPFFFGLILGQFVIGSIGNILGIIFDVPTYQFWQ
jgi:hypothetical protein